MIDKGSHIWLRVLAAMTIISTGLASIWYGVHIYRALRGKRKLKGLE